MPQEFVGFLRRCPAVVAGDGHLDVVRNGLSPERVNLLQDLVCHRNGVCAGPFGNGQSHRRLFGTRVRARCAAAKKHVLRRLLRVVFDVCDFPQIHRLAARHAHHHVPDVLRVRKKVAGFDDGFAIVAGDSSGDALPVGLSQHGDNFRRREIAGREARRIQQYAQLPL